jgi:DnaJ-class molecular chaperone
MHEGMEDEYINGEYEEADTSGPFHVDCAFCSGTGVHPGTMKSLTHDRCPTCQGKGILHFEGSRNNYNPCPRCEGTGREPESASIKPCRACDGYGIV